jgi:hypothetical protein
LIQQHSGHSEFHSAVSTRLDSTRAIHRIALFYARRIRQETPANIEIPMSASVFHSGARKGGWNQSLSLSIIASIGKVTRLQIFFTGR